MSLPISPISEFENIKASNQMRHRDLISQAFNLEPYLQTTNLATPQISAGNNTELINLLAMTAYNQIALKALALGGEPGLISTSNFSSQLTTDAAANKPNAFIQKAYASSTPQIEGAKSIAQKISSLYEGGQVTGDFDGQGLSVGFLQWNIGSGTLQPLLKEMATENPQEFQEIFGGQMAGTNQKLSEVLKDVLKMSKSQQLQWAKSINNSSDKITEPWRSAFNELVKNERFIEIENKHSESYQAKATQIMGDMGVKTVRSYALAFDIAVQNGSVKASAQALIDGALEGKSNALTNPQDPKLTANQRTVVSDLMVKIKGTSDNDLKKLYYTAAAVAISSRDQYVKDVWSRKSTIIAGEGKVHGKTLAMDQNMGLSDHALG